MTSILAVFSSVFLLAASTVLFPTALHAQPSRPARELPAKSEKIDVGDPLPVEVMTAKLMLLNGESFTLESRKGIVVIYFWATWCKPCRMQDPELIKLQEKYRDKGVIIIGLNVDSEAKKDIDAYREQMRISFPTVTSEPKFRNALISISGFSGIPQSIILREGKLLGVFKGFQPNRTSADMERLIAATLADAAEH